MRVLLLVCLGLACSTPPSTTPSTTPPAADETPAVADAGLDLDNPKACAPCHAEVVAEWETSMHAHAHHDNDPIFAGMRTLRMEKQGDQVAAKCAQCHNPRDPGNPDSPAGKAGVSCATCHHLESVDTDPSKKGAAALIRPEGPILRGPHAITNTGAPHGVGAAAPRIADGKTLCLACHGAMKNPAGAVTCNTGPEHAASGSTQSCTNCHMPEVDGSSGAVSTRPTHRSHAFLGGHTLFADPPDPSFMASAVKADLQRDGTNVQLTLTSTSGHSVPSGFPGRMVIVRATALDADGVVVWSNLAGDPMKDDPQSVLNTVYVDADGAPTMPPFAERIGRDNRLVAGEPRTLSWTVPEGAATVRAELLYRLVPPPAVKALGLTGQPVAESRPFLTVER